MVYYVVNILLHIIEVDSASIEQVAIVQPNQEPLQSCLY